MTTKMTRNLAGKMTKTLRSVVLVCALALASVTLGAPPVAADCHDGDPGDAAQCVVNDVAAGVENWADATTGTGFVDIGATSNCHQASVGWQDWDVDDDAICDGDLHAITGTHGATRSQALPPGVDVGARVVLGELWVAGELVDRCVPAGDPGDVSSCQTVAVVATTDCLDIRAVSVLNTGKTIEATAIGPWTYC